MPRTDWYIVDNGARFGLLITRSSTLSFTERLGIAIGVIQTRWPPRCTRLPTSSNWFFANIDGRDGEFNFTPRHAGRNGPPTKKKIYEADLTKGGAPWYRFPWRKKRREAWTSSWNNFWERWNVEGILFVRRLALFEFGRRLKLRGEIRACASQLHRLETHSRSGPLSVSDNSTSPLPTTCYAFPFGARFDRNCKENSRRKEFHADASAHCLFIRQPTSALLFSKSRARYTRLDKYDTVSLCPFSRWNVLKRLIESRVRMCFPRLRERERERESQIQNFLSFFFFW